MTEVLYEDFESLHKILVSRAKQISNLIFLANGYRDNGESFKLLSMKPYGFSLTQLFRVGICSLPRRFCLFHRYFYGEYPCGKTCAFGKKCKENRICFFPGFLLWCAR